VEVWGYSAVTTSYDFDAPIDEAGDATPKFAALRKVFGRYVSVPPGPIPPPAAKGNYGTILMTHYAPLFSSLTLFATTTAPLPLSMEQLGYGYGYVLYVTRLFALSKATQLTITAVQDRALVYLDGVYQGVLGWTEPKEPTQLTLTPSGSSNPLLQILVENKGRCSGEVEDFSCARKGVTGTVELNDKTLTNWTMYHLPMESLSTLKINWRPYGGTPVTQMPTFYRGEFVIRDATPRDTFLLTDGWGHGFVVLNGVNLGRFSERGPQRSLYVPGSILRGSSATNEVIIFESDVPSTIVNHLVSRNVTALDYRLWD